MMIFDSTNQAGQRKGRYTRLKSERTTWLQEYPLRCELPSDTEDVHPYTRGQLDLVLREMRHVGLFSASTSDQDCRDAIRKIVGEIRQKGQ